MTEDINRGARDGTLRIAIRRFGPFEAAITRQWEDFCRVSGCSLRLEYESLDLNPLYESLFTSGGLRNGDWDLAFIVTDWLADAVANDMLRDLAGDMAVDPVPDYPDGWTPALTEMQRFGDAIYGLPYHDGPECLIYRRDLFDDPKERAAFQAQYGYPLAPPVTWIQFEDVARFFTRPDDDLYGTVFAAYPDGHNTVYDFCLHLWSRGGELTDDQGRPTIDTPAAIAALDYYRRLVNDRTVSPPGANQIDSVKSGEMFAAGQIAMMVNWFGFAAICEQPGCPVKGKTAVTTIPRVAGRPPVSLIVYWLLAVAAGSPHPAEAYAFARHCCTPAMDNLTTMQGGIGCRLSTWTDPEVNALVPFYAALPRLHEGTRTLPRSRELPSLVHIIDAAVQTALTSGEPSAAILARAQQQARDIRL